MEIYNTFTGLRSDGRKSNELRNISIELGKLPYCTGSASFKIGLTEIIAQVFGPFDKSNDDQPNVKVDFEYSYFSKNPHAATNRPKGRYTDISLNIQRILCEVVDFTRISKSYVSVNIIVLQDDGSVLSSAVNAATLALMNAGISLKGFPVSFSIALYEKIPLVDATRDECSFKNTVFDVTMYNSTKEIISVSISSKISPSEAESLLKLSQDLCDKVYKKISNLLIENAY